MEIGDRQTRIPLPLLWVHVRNREWVWAAPPCCCLAEAVWWGGMGALLPLGRQSNEGKRQCKAGDEGKTQDACALDLRSYFWV